MTDWLKKFFKKEESPVTDTDHALYHSEENEEVSMDDTARFQLSDIPEKRSGGFADFFKKHRNRFLGTGIAISALILILVIAMILITVLNPLNGYLQVAVSKGNVIHSMNVEGTLETNAAYHITSLVSGSVVESFPEVGEEIPAGTVLYRLDDTEAQLAVKQAENRLEKARAAGTSTPASLKIYSTEAGTVQSMSITVGSTVAAGQVVATVKRSDDSVVSVTSMVSGTVSSLSVRKGGTVSAGSLIAMVTDHQAEREQKASVYDQKGYEYDLEVAKTQLANYTIKAPVSGIVTEKNANVGDNVGITTDKPLMVMVDTTSMKFTFQVDEKELAHVEVEQNATITTESVPDKTFQGKVSRISHQGVRNDEGKLLFDVDVTVDNTGELKAGMDVKAKVVLASATNTLYLPKKALLQSDGKTAMVLILEEETATTAPKATATATSTTGSISVGPEIKVPKGCRLVKVRCGVSDGTNVQITSGLKQNQIVVYNPEWTEEYLTAPKPTATVTPAKPSMLPEETSSPMVTGAPLEETPATNPPVATAPITSEEEERLKQEILDKIRENEQNNNL